MIPNIKHQTQMEIYLAVAAGSALGGMARYGFSGLVTLRMGFTFPWGTLFVNIAGSFIIGFFLSFTETGGAPQLSPTAHQFFTYGFLGGFTTFSSFSLETLNLIREGEWERAGGYLFASLFACLLAVGAGYWLGTTA